MTSNGVIHVIGMDAAPTRALSEPALAAVAQAEVIFGEERHLARLPAHRAETQPYPRPFQALAEALRSRCNQSLVLLASGDPLLFGVGGWLVRQISADRLRFHPAVSSLQSAFARAGLPWQDAELVSLHGRPLPHLRRFLRRNRLLGLLTDDNSTPQAIANELVNHGLGSSTVWVAEALGLADERLRVFHASELAERDITVDPLNVVLVRTRGQGDTLPEFPGIADEAFATDKPAGGLITKREVRLTALSLLQPAAEEVGWDVGAGCGGLAVEWARWSRLSHVYAVERNIERLEAMEANSARFGTGANLSAIQGQAPEALATLPDPDSVFVGGGGATLADILAYCWERLRPAGRLVAVSVTEASRSTLQQFAGQRGEWTQLSVARGETLAGELTLRPKLPVLLLRLDKPLGYDT